MQTHALTGIVICKDGAETLAACLESLSFCDQILVADDGSRDESVSIAKSHGANIFELSPTDSFAEKRNQALERVKAGWILFLDADERISKRLASEIKKAITTSDVNGFYLQRRDVFLGSKLHFGEVGILGALGVGGVGSGGKLLRLVRAAKGKWERQVHEVLLVSGVCKSLDKGEIIHTPHPSLESFIESINRYTDLEVRERAKIKKPSSLFAWLQLFFYPPAKFGVNYFLRLGLLDGLPGLIHAYFMSLYSLLVRIKILEYVRSS